MTGSVKARPVVLCYVLWLEPSRAETRRSRRVVRSMPDPGTSLLIGPLWMMDHGSDGVPARVHVACSCACQEKSSIGRRTHLMPSLVIIIARSYGAPTSFRVPGTPSQFHENRSPDQQGCIYEPRDVCFFHDAAVNFY